MYSKNFKMPCFGLFEQFPPPKLLTAQATSMDKSEKKETHPRPPISKDKVLRVVEEGGHALPGGGSNTKAQAMR